MSSRPEISAAIDRLSSDSENDRREAATELHGFVDRHPQELEAQLSELIDAVENSRAGAEIQPILEELCIKRNGLGGNLLPPLLRWLEDPQSYNFEPEAKEALASSLPTFGRFSAKITSEHADDLLQLFENPTYRPHVGEALVEAGKKSLECAKSVLESIQAWLSRVDEISEKTGSDLTDVTAKIRRERVDSDSALAGIYDFSSILAGIYGSLLEFHPQNEQALRELDTALEDEFEQARATASQLEDSARFPGRTRVQLAIAIAKNHPRLGEDLLDKVVSGLFFPDLSDDARDAILTLADSENVNFDSLIGEITKAIHLLQDRNQDPAAAIHTLSAILEAHRDSATPMFLDRLEAGEYWDPTKTSKLDLASPADTLLHGTSMERWEKVGTAGLRALSAEQAEVAAETAVCLLADANSNQRRRLGIQLLDLSTEKVVSQAAAGQVREILENHDWDTDSDIRFERCVASIAESSQNNAVALVNGLLARLEEQAGWNKVEAELDYLDIVVDAEPGAFQGRLTRTLKLADRAGKDSEWAVSKQLVGLAKESLEADSTRPGDETLSYLTELLEIDRDSVKSAVIKTIGVSGVYPVPEYIQELRDCSNGRIENSVDWAENRIEENKSDIQTPQSLPTSGQEIIDAFDDGLVRYRNENGGWRPIRLSDESRAILRESFDVDVESSDQSHRSVVLPHHEPEVMMIFTAASALAARANGGNLALLSPIWDNSRWGTKSLIQEQLQRFGISSEHQSNVAAIPLSEWLPPARESDGEVIAYDDEDADQNLILIKRIESLSGLSNVESVLVNQFDSAKFEPIELEDRIRNQQPSARVLSVYGLFTERAYEEFTSWGPPLDYPSRAITTTGALEDGSLSAESTQDRTIDVSREDRDNVEPEMEKRAVEDVATLCNRDTVELVSVGDNNFAEAFDRVYTLGAEVRDEASPEVGNEILSHLFRFERLPVSVSRHDDWVLEQRLAGEIYLPDEIEKRLDEFEELASRSDRTGDAAIIREAVRDLDDVAYALRDSNPMVEYIEETIVADCTETESVGVLTSSVSEAKMLREAVDERLEHDERSRLTIAPPKRARKLNRVSKLLVCGPQRPFKALFYLLPNADEIEVLTFGGRWATLIERHLEQAAEELHNRSGLPVTPPEVQKPEQEEDNQAVHEQRESKTTNDSSPESESVPSTEFEENASIERDERKYAPAGRGHSDVDIDEIFETAMSLSDDPEDSRQPANFATYSIEITGGEKIHKSGSDHLLTAVESDGEVIWKWRSPRSLSSGNKILRLSETLEETLWQSWLEQKYSEQLEGQDAASVLTGVRVWYQEVSKIFDIFGDGEDPNFSDLYSHITSEADEFDRGYDALKSWFKGVSDAERALDLVIDGDLRIGPRSIEDIRAVGEAFDREKLVEHADTIGRSMRTCRTFNRQKGSTFKEGLVSVINQRELDQLGEGFSIHTLESVVRTTDSES